jgi:hypothetical protein
VSGDGPRELPDWLSACPPVSLSLVNPDGANIAVSVTEHRSGRLVLVLQGGMWRCALTPTSVRAMARLVTDHERFLAGGRRDPGRDRDGE